MHGPYVADRQLFRLAIERGSAFHVAVFGVAGLLGLAVAAELLTSELASGSRGELIAISLLGGWGFVAVGVVVRRRRPTNCVGVLMLALGCTWLLAGLRFSDGGRVAITLGMLGGWLWAALLAHLLLAFPDGHLIGWPERTLVAAAYAIATVVQWTWVLFTDAHTDHPGGCPQCPAPLVSLAQDPGFAQPLKVVEQGAAAMVGLAVCVLLVVHWRRGPRVQRCALTPVVCVGLAVAVLLATGTAAFAVGLHDLGRAFEWPWDASVVLMPFAFLVGMVRTRFRRAVGVSQLVEELDKLPTPDDVPAALARALGDESLSVLYWLPQAGHYVDGDGHVVPLPDRTSGRAVTHVEIDGRRVAALVHDPSLSEEARLVRAAGRTAALWLERARLEAERSARIVELRESRARIVEAGDAERRRLERDLHDGAQQRLAALLLQARLERRALDPPDKATEALLESLEEG